MEWISIEDRLPEVKAGKFIVRLKNKEEIDAYFYDDSISWIAFYGQKTSHWWKSYGDHQRLDNVTHWRESCKE